MAKLNTTTSKLLPSLGDKMSAMQAGRQQEEQPPIAPEGTLYRGGGEGRVYGHVPQ
jgi:hypothetical protein